MYCTGIGGSTVAQELENLKPLAGRPKPIQPEEYKGRLQQLCGLMKKEGVAVTYIDAGPNLYYFTGIQWSPSERLVGALLFADGTLVYVVPHFEIGTIRELIQLDGEILPWQEHDNVYEVVAQRLDGQGAFHLAVDDRAAYRISAGFSEFVPNAKQCSAESLFRECRMYKSQAEIEIIQYAMDTTMEVQKASARILRPGISTAEVVDFIHRAHIKMGATKGSYFCIVLFGKDSSFPHGVKNPKDLEDGDIVLVDTGCEFDGYISDITRTYCYGTPTEKQQRIWQAERDAQEAAFLAVEKEAPCGQIDDSTRKSLESYGLGPGYKLPGLPHRVGHGIGVEIHEHPYIVKGNELPLKKGMCFSIEPMICVENEFGIRLEDHVYIGENGPVWFTDPAKSLQDPFGHDNN